jgi:hypothetical protein
MTDAINGRQQRLRNMARAISSSQHQGLDRSTIAASLLVSAGRGWQKHASQKKMHRSLFSLDRPGQWPYLMLVNNGALPHRIRENNKC